LWQIKQTLPSNLTALGDGQEIVLVDYGSTDGLSEWVWANFRQDIARGRLVFFEVKNEVSWSSPRAKNLAHRLSRGDYLFNLDADNFITPQDIALIREERQRRVPCHQWTGVWGDGSYGRIGMPRKLFFGIGGYDETMLPMAGQDFDLVQRLAAAKRPVVVIPPPEKPAVANTHAQKMAAIGQPGLNGGDDKAKSRWERMNAINLETSRLRLAAQGPRRSDGFQTYRGLLNGHMIVIDGLNRKVVARPGAGAVPR
jgi:glycosyltransferase involved in cell wall biosynthesis